ncbi:MAG: ABC transporter permease, partial [Proteobacteria bacterium]|nr:ABC transporter permease [Pseudomonadota bacterium]
MLSWKIAWRNVWRHKGKSLVVGTILFLGALLMTVGNSIITGAREGMTENMVNRLTGHLVIKPTAQKEDEVFVGGMTALKVLPGYPQIKTILKENEIVDSFAPMTRGMASILNPDGKQGQIFIYGVNFDEYQRTFLNNVQASEGQLLDGGVRGMLITEQTRERIINRQKFWVVPQGLTKEDTVLYRDPQKYAYFDVQDPKVVTKAKKQADDGKLKTVDELIILGFGPSSFGNDIRVPVKGIFKFKNLNQIWKDVTFMDIESYRESFGHISAANSAVELTESQQEIMDADSDDMDNMFGSGDVVESAPTQTETYDLSALKHKAEIPREPVDIDQGAYNFVAVKIKPGIGLLKAQKQLQQTLDNAKVPAQVLTWKKAVGVVSQFASISQGALSVFVLFIFFVAIIVIMNTLSMAALERVSEIGMMRAVGAQKGFISKMFLTETFLLSFVFGGAGIVIGALISLFLAFLKIPVTDNEMLSLLFASDTFQPVITAPSLISGVVQLGIVTILAVLYPLYVARKITPM